MIDPIIEKMARRLAQLFHPDLDPMTQVCTMEPHRVSLPGAVGHIVQTDYVYPLWGHYYLMAAELVRDGLVGVPVKDEVLSAIKTGLRWVEQTGGQDSETAQAMRSAISKIKETEK